MRKLLPPAYLLPLALLAGGNALYTFLATPAVFRAFERSLAGEVVASMMGGYFGWNLALWALALGLGAAAMARSPRRLELALLGVGLLASLLVVGWLYPAILEVRGKVPSFAADAPLGEARLLFRRLHGVSMALNLLQLACSAALLVLFARRGPRSEP